MSIHADDALLRRAAYDLARFLSSLDETGSHLGNQDFGMVNPGEETLRMSVEDWGADFHECDLMGWLIWLNRWRSRSNPGQGGVLIG